MEANVARSIYRSGKVLEKRNPNAFRRVFSPISGADLNIMVVFSGFDEFGSGWGNSETTWEQDYNEMFGWRSLRYNQIRGDAAIRDYGGQIVETLEFRPDMSTSIE